MLTALATVAIAVIAYWQLGSLARTSRADFVYRLKKDFFTPETRKLLFLIENDLLNFHADTIPYFEISGSDDPKVKARSNELEITRNTVSTYDVDDLLLGLLEDVGIFWTSRHFNFTDVYEEFSSYIEACGKNEAIADYLKWLRSDPDSADIYDHFSKLYKECVRRGKQIRTKKME